MPNTREKLIELLECTYGQVDDRDYDCYGECNTCKAEHLIANGVGFLPKWISVAEQLPETSQRVIVCRKDGRVEQGVYQGGGVGPDNTLEYNGEEYVLKKNIQKI